MEGFRNPRQHLIDEEMDVPIGTIDPFQCTHALMNGPGTDHAHNFTRLWSMDGLDGRELLDACAHVHDKLSELVEEAHQRLGASIVSHARADSNRRLPCMENID